MKTICLIGAGNWGKNYINVLSKLNVNLIVANRNNWQKIIDQIPDGVIIATPPDSHVEIASYVLDKKIPVMIEKPLALSYNDAIKLQKYNSTILVNYLHLFSPAYQELCKIAKTKKILKIKSEGCNWGPFRNYSVLFDYTPHDLSMGMYLTNNLNPNIIKIEKISYEIGEKYNILLKYNNIEHHIINSNVSSNKKRYFEVMCDDGDILLYDDLNKNKFFVNGINKSINDIPTLNNSINSFFNLIDGINDDRFGLDLSLKLLSAIEQ